MRESWRLGLFELWVAYGVTDAPYILQKGALFHELTYWEDMGL